MNKGLIAFALVVFLVLTACGEGPGYGAAVSSATKTDFDFYLGVNTEKKYTFETCPGGPKVGYPRVYCNNGEMDYWWYREIEGGDPVIFNELNYRTQQPRQHGCNWQKFDLVLADGPVSATGRGNAVRTLRTLGGANWGGGWHSYSPVELDALGDSFGVLDIQLGIHDKGARTKVCERKYELTFDYAKDLIENSASIELQDNIISLGTIADIVGSSTAMFDLVQNRETVRVFSPDQIAIGFSTVDPGAIVEWEMTTQADLDQMIYACLDADRNGICDYGKAQLCFNRGGDFYDDACCGVDANAPLCSYVPSVEAYCADTADGPSWLPLNDGIGHVVEVGGTCGFTVDAVSDGSSFLLCASNASLDPAIDAITSSVRGESIFAIAAGNETHDYACTNGQFMECGGIGPFSGNQSSMGIGHELYVNDSLHFCTDDNRWVLSLDSYSGVCDSVPGLTWTGTHCCGEADDPLKTYQEYDPSVGACFNNTFIASGELVENGTVLNYRGKFVFCRPGDSPNLMQSPTPLAPFSFEPYTYGLCGDPLGTNSSVFAVCNSFGRWTLRQDGNETYNKSVAWSTNGRAAGCCAYDECWDGARCVAQGEYYKLGGRGFRCV